MNARQITILALVLLASVSSAQTVAPPFSGPYTVTDLGSITGLPTNYGGLTFKAGDSNTIIIGGKANAADGLFYEVPLIRGAGQHITGFGTPVALGFGGNNDGGIAYGPGGVLFYSKYNLNTVGQVKPGANADSKVVALGPLGVAVSPGALGFVPPGFGGEGRLKVCSYSAGQFYDITYAADGTGTFNLSAATQTATLSGSPEGFIYAPPGSPLFPNPTLLVTEYGAGKVAAYDVDGNGNPQVATRRDFITGLSGGEGATIDPVTGDFLFSTFGGGSRVIQVRGFTPPPPAATVTVTSSVNPSFVGDSVTLTATITGVAPITGTVTFKDNGTDIAGCVNVAVSSNAASCVTSSLALGDHPIGAYYGGNSTNGAGSGTLMQQVLNQPPGGVGAGNVLWLDASDMTTLYGDAACTQPVTVSGSSVACWLDKSADGSNVTDVGPSNGEPTWLENQFGGKPALQFSKTESDTLRNVLGTPWTGDYTEFVVFQQIGTPEEYDSFFSNGPDANGPYHQITHLGGSFQWFHSSTRLTIEQWSNELKLYAVRGSGTGTEVFADGASRGTDAQTGGRTFAQYRINQNRSGSLYNNSKIAEIIVYDRALGDCEMEQVNTYLGLKYGRDFFDIGSSWSYTTPYDKDVNGIASIPGACPSPRLIDRATSDIVTIDNPTDLDPGEVLLIGHNGAGLGTNNVDVPAGYEVRLNQLWRIDADQVTDGVGVRVTFDVTTAVNSIDLTNPSELAILIHTNPNNMAAGTQVLNPTVNGNLVIFDNVNLPDGQYFTLAHHVSPGIFVHNTGDVTFPSQGAPVVVAPNLEIFFANPAQPIDQAKVDISENFQSGADVLGIAGQTGTSGTVGGLAWSWDASIGVLTLTGAGTPATYQAALRQVTFRNTSGTPSTARRKLTYSLGSGLQYAGTGHFYEFVPSPLITWTAARTGAAARSYFGLQGYLVTVTSQGESDFILGKLKGRQGWIGASDGAVANAWRWVTGPEGLEDGGQGRLFSNGATAAGGAFVNWMPGQPDGSGDAAYFIGTTSWAGSVPAKWDDVPATYTDFMQGYVTEYGGMPLDPALHLADDAFVSIATPTLTLTKTAGTDPVNVATNVTYTLGYSNAGAAPSLNVTLHDVIPTGATFVSATGGGTLTGNTVTWNLGTLAASASGSVTVTVTAPSAVGTMTNTSDIGAANAATVQATESVTIIGPTLTLRKTGPDGVAVGGNLVYTLQYGNTGTGNAASPVLTDTIPTGSTFVSASNGGTCVDSTPAPCAGPSDGTHVVTWNLTDIASGGSGSVTVTLTAPATTGNLTNRAGLTATAATAVSASATTRVTSCPNASLPCLTKGFAPGTIEANTENSTLTISLENGTDGAARAVTFTDNLPAGLELAAVPASPQCGGGTITGAVGGTTLTVTGASLGPGLENCDITATVRGTTPGAKTNDRSRFSNATSVDLTGATATVVVTQPNLTLTKTAAPTSVLVNGTVTYTLAYENTGNGTATGVQLVDSIPAGATYVSSTPAGTVGGGNVTWTLGDLGAGASGSVSVVFTAPGSPTTLNNTATLTAANATTANANASVNVFGQPAFTFTITDSPDPVKDGTNLYYTLQLTNTGPVAATGTTVTLPVPTNTTFVATTGGGAPSGGTITWNLGSIAPGQTVSVTATVAVNAALPEGTIITASAQADAGNLPGPVNASAQTRVSSEPLLEVTITANPVVALPGGSITYFIDYANRGTSVATGAILTFTAPASTLVDTAIGNPTLAGQTATWALGSILPGQSGSRAVTVNVDSGVALGSALTASSAITSATTCGSPAAPCSATDDVTTRVENAAVLRLVKSAPANVAAGGTLTYELRYENVGNVDAQSVSLSDLLPDNTQFVSASSGGTCGDGQTPPGPCTGFTDGSHRVEWNLGTVGPGSGTVFLTVRVLSPLADGTQLVNTANVLSTDPSGPQPASAQASTTVTSAPVLTLSKFGPTQVSAGGLLTYTLSYRNTGAAQATGVVLTDQIPANTTFVSGSGGTFAGGVVTWNLGTLAAGATGSVSLTLGVNTPLPDGTTLVNNASLSSNETGSVSSQVSTAAISAPVATVTLTSTPSAAVAAGQSLTYVASFRNDGSDDMTGSVLTAHLPLGLSPSLIGGGGTFDAAASTITWTLGTLAVGSGGSHTFALTVPIGIANGTFIATSAALSSTNAPTASVTHPVIVSASPLLEITKTAPPTAQAGGSITYTLDYRNTGNGTAFNVVLTDTLPVDTTYATAQGAHSVSGNTVTWSLGDLAPGAGGTVSVVATVRSPLANNTPLVNTASIRASNLPPRSTVATTSATSQAVLTLAKTGPAQVAAGGQIAYALSYQNVGTTVADGVVLVDYLPANTSFVSATGGGTHAGGIVTWNLGSIPAGAGSAVTVLVNVASPLPNGTSLVNAANIRSTTTPPLGATAQTTVTSAPLLTVTKTASPSFVLAGQQVLYTITYRNDGNSDSLNTTLTDLVPTNAVFFLNTQNNGPGAFNPGTGLVTWNLGTVAAGSSGTEQVTVTVPIGTPDGTQLINSVTITGDGAPPTSSQIPVVVLAQPVLRLLKTANTPLAVPGANVTYTIEYQNIGTATWTGGTIVDTIPAFTNFVSATGGGVFNAGSRTVTWTVPDTAPGSGASYSLVLSVDSTNPPPDGSTLTNAVQLDTNETQPVASLAPITVAAPVLTLNKSGAPNSVAAGGQINYLLQYANTGTTTAHAVTLTDTLGPNVIHVSSTSGGVYNPATRTVTWNVPDIPPGASGTVSLLVEVIAPLVGGTVISNTAFIDSAETSPTPGSSLNSVQATATLTLNVTASPNPAFSGTPLTYTIVVTNPGTVDAPIVVVTQQLPGGTSFISADNGGAYSAPGNIITWSLGTLPPGTSRTLTAQVFVGVGTGVLTSFIDVTSLGSLPTTVTSAVPVGVMQIPALSPFWLMMLAAGLAMLGVAAIRMRP